MSDDVSSGAAARIYRQLRRRRLAFWLVLLIYLPLMLLVQKVYPGKYGLFIAFGAWIGGLIVAALVLALARCPACGQTFHMNGMTFLPVRRCLHCGRHVKQLLKESA